MKIQKPITAFSQSEKIKSGLIWISQGIEITNGLPEKERQGAKIIHSLLSMIASEIHLARSLAQDELWNNAEKDIHMATVMINSGVAHEAVFHLTQALTHVTTIGQRSLAFLKQEGFL
ncbi:MAG: hypothetical protein GY749_43840 [Desulfobacteraceae bacterium]|nr:hypothetical protein [Desulfobacteraceae bacterium]